MSCQIGIVGLPNVGKSTLFTALTKNKVEIANYPFCTIDPNVGVVEVPDERLNKIAQITGSQKTVPTIIEFVDIAGLVKNAHQGEGLGNQFLSHIREVDAIIEVVRSFHDSNVAHVSGEVNPDSDKETVNLELVMADLETVNKKLDKINNQLKGPHNKILDKELALLNKIKDTLNNGKWAATTILEDEDREMIKNLNLLTLKPLLYVYNVDEEELKNYDNLPDNTIAICAKLEAELTELSDKEMREYLQDSGIKQTGLDKLIQTAYKLLGLITFFSSEPKESRAWTIVNGTKAPQAGGVIHTDFQKKFIRAEIVTYENFVKYGGWRGNREKGTLRTEGKEYVVKDGDVVMFKI